MSRHRLTVAVPLVLATMALGGPALAHGSGEHPPKPQVIPRHQSRGNPPRVLSDRQQVLPFTGADVTGFAVAGLAGIAAGAGLLRRARAGARS
jgi:hypothetical protein